MYNNILSELLEFLISNASELADPSKSRWRSVHYIKNEKFVLGVYRIHIDDFLPSFMKNMRMVSDELYILIEEKYSELVHFDIQTGWLTIQG